MGSMKTPFATKIPSTFQMPQEVNLTDKDGRVHRVVEAESLRRVLMTIYNQINNPVATQAATAAPAAATQPSFSYNETPKDSGDHKNFSLLHSPSPQQSLQLNVNKGAGGIPFQFGVDYTLKNNLVTLTAAIVGTFSIWASYQYTK